MKHGALGEGRSGHEPSPWKRVDLSGFYGFFLLAGDGFGEPEGHSRFQAGSTCRLLSMGLANMDFEAVQTKGFRFRIEGSGLHIQQLHLKCRLPGACTHAFKWLC